MTRRKKIYIVLRGEKGEGGNVLKVFVDPDRAIEQAPALTKPCFGPWVGGSVSEGSVTRCDMGVHDLYRFKKVAPYLDNCIRTAMAIARLRAHHYRGTVP